ncbi:amidohydrolase [Opitutaceae bacterium TAV4]|nr:amidohydrolase [Opitutaceae bacterium TAV4]RRJ98662.1 amidohydrolase [Opitutaceae bacterium TAV3]
MLIDSHVHLPSPEVSKGHSCEGIFRTVADAVALLKKCGVTGIVFNMWRGVFADSEEDVNRANEQALALYDEDPGFFYPGAVIHPLFPDASEKWLGRFRERNLMWVGEVVPYRSHVEFGQPEWMRLFEICRRNGQIAHLHGSKGVRDVARAMPDLKIVSAHIFPDFLKELSACPNIWLDLSGVESGQRLGRMEMALEHFGPDRLIWGTDFQVFDPEVFIVRARNAFPDTETREKIFAGNLLRLLALAGGVPAFQKKAG